MAVITISRQYGSGGDEIAARVCDILGYAYFDKNLMVRVATELGAFPEKQVVDFSEDTYTMRNFTERLFGSRRIKFETQVEDASGATSIQVQSLDEKEGVALMHKTIMAAYEYGNVVIVGRGGQAILREQPDVLHVRIEAPLGARVLRVKERAKITIGEATELTRNKDLAAETYLSKFFDIDWSDPLLYHLLFNTGKWDADAVAEIIVNALTHLKTVKLGLT
ncbi:MAG TPA: cytidylate kinase-like family protein [Anaerolineae bacterium]|nr:cytidylate kinase-like family protein [Anaerolineae bacterium]HQH39423.1 cytidylate kinase-like family protein [Anaerolineae bacterium]